MKLRNKKTGEITENIFIYDGFICVDAWKGDSGTYDTLAELNEEWEDYKPKEPLIKDMKIRKAVRAWAEANGFDNEGYYFEVHSLPAGTRFCAGNYDVEFIGFFLYELKANSEYTLAELCGYEENEIQI